jgi:hypothetical protein
MRCPVTVLSRLVACNDLHDAVVCQLRTLMIVNTDDAFAAYFLMKLGEIR